MLTGSGIFLSCLCTFYEGRTIGTYTQNYVQLFDYLTAIVFFIIIKYIVLMVVPQLGEGRLSEIIYQIGPLTFGIYLLDPYLKLVICQEYETFMGQYFPIVFVSIGWCVVSMILGGVITFILKKIPGFNKIL